jgi:hypothetical protein
MHQAGSSVSSSIYPINRPDGTEQRLQFLAIRRIVPKEVKTEGLDVVDCSSAELRGEICFLGAAWLSVQGEDDESSDVKDAICDDTCFEDGAHGGR